MFRCVDAMSGAMDEISTVTSTCNERTHNVINLPPLNTFTGLDAFADKGCASMTQIVGEFCEKLIFGSDQQTTSGTVALQLFSREWGNKALSKIGRTHHVNSQRADQFPGSGIHI